MCYAKQLRSKNLARIAKPENHWATPRGLVVMLDKKHNFSRCPETGELFDPCPLDHSIDLWDGTKIEWPQSVFVNPPYDLASKTAFVNKAFYEAQQGKKVVLLLPVSTSTELFHNIILPYGTITFLKKRPYYEGINSKGAWCNPFASYIPDETRRRLGLEVCNYGPNRAQVTSAGAHDAMIVVFELPS